MISDSQTRWPVQFAAVAVGFELGLPPLAILTLAAIVILLQDLDPSAGVPAGEVADLVVRGSPSARPGKVPQALRALACAGLVRLDGDSPEEARVWLLVDPQSFPFSARALDALDATAAAAETGALDLVPPFVFSEVQ